MRIFRPDQVRPSILDIFQRLDIAGTGDHFDLLAQQILDLARPARAEFVNNNCLNFLVFRTEINAFLRVQVSSSGRRLQHGRDRFRRLESGR